MDDDLELGHISFKTAFTCKLQALEHEYEEHKHHYNHDRRRANYILNLGDTDENKPGNKSQIYNNHEDINFIMEEIDFKIEHQRKTSSFKINRSRKHSYTAMEEEAVQAVFHNKMQKTKSDNKGWAQKLIPSISLKKKASEPIEGMNSI